jgi:hypothetical protein
MLFPGRPRARGKGWPGRMRLKGRAVGPELRSRGWGWGYGAGAGAGAGPGARAAGPELGLGGRAGLELGFVLGRVDAGFYDQGA